MSRFSNIRILMTADTVGGVWTYATGLTTALEASGADICLVTTGPRPRADQRTMLSDSVQVIESDLALEWQDPEGNDVAHAREFLGAIEQQFRPDIVHLNSFREASFGWSAPVVLVAHSCVNSWGAACNDSTFLREPSWQRYTELVTDGLEHADAWVAPTRAHQDIMRELYRPSHAGLVIHNGATLRADGIPTKNQFILAAGRMWDAAKNLAVLANAARDLDWPVFVAGTTDRSAGKLAPHIELIGELSHAELGARMLRAAIFVSPAKYEPFGLSVLEAASTGCALILADIPSFRELWDDAALFAAPDDVASLRKLLADLCTDSRKRQRLQNAAFRLAQNYPLKRMVESYARLYRKLLSPCRSREPAVREARA